MSYKINKIKFIVYQMMIRTIKKIKQGKGMVRLREVESCDFKHSSQEGFTEMTLSKDLKKRVRCPMWVLESRKSQQRE